MPGSFTDQIIWSNSEVKAFMECLRLDEEVTNNEGPYYLIGKNII